MVMLPVGLMQRHCLFKDVGVFCLVGPGALRAFDADEVAEVVAKGLEIGAFGGSGIGPLGNEISKHHVIPHDAAHLMSNGKNMMRSYL